MSARTRSVREGTLDDVPRFIELGERFYSDEGERTACSDALARFAISHICDADRIFLVTGTPIVAFLSGLVAPHYFTGEHTAFKTAWYAIPGSKGHGAHLLRAFEAWAKEKGARRIIVAGRLDRTLTLLKRLDYQPLETVFSKDIPWQKQPYPFS
jgi:GNAT superfamily N-acetyltransferase